MLKKIIATLIIILLSLSILTSSVRGASLQSQKSDLEDKIDSAQEEKQEVKEGISDALKEVEELSASIEENESKLETINKQLVTLNKEIKELKQELEETQEKYNKQEEAFKNKMILSYEMGQTSYLDVLLNSKGILDFLSNYYLISEILQNDDDLLDSLEEQKNKIEKDKQELEEKQKEIKTQKAEQEKINVLLSNQKTQKQNEVSKLSEKEKQLSSEIDKYKAEVKKIEAELTEAAKNAASSGKVYTGGAFLWPCPSYTRISSPYGYRICPYHGKELHSGIDMAAPYGSAILAAADGQVITAGWLNSYGYTVMIYHGSGLTTIYAHCSSLLVSVGQNVSKGDKIAKVGSTGDSTGNHLHFGVKLNGRYTSPNPYLGM